MKVNCQDYRESMQLLGLQLRLKKGVTDPKEQKEVEDRIKILEKKLDMV